METVSDTGSVVIPPAVVSAWDAGRNVYVWGMSEDGRRVLIVDLDGGQVSVASVDAVNGLGRWECSADHLRAYSDLYRDRFPIIY